jgi:hypothetical protein
MKLETSRRRRCPAVHHARRATRVRPLVEALEDRVTPANIGYYDMDLGQGNPTQVAAIVAAGHTPVLLNNLAPADLTGIAVIDVQNPNNSGYGAEYLSHLTDIANAVAGGAVLVIHDRFVDLAETILPAGGSFNIIRDTSTPSGADIDVQNNTTLVTNGPGGIVNNTTLDGGNLSNHGYAIAASLPATAALILSTNDPTHIVTFAYQHGAGTVIYSSIPLDFYLTGANNFSNIYAPNVLAYAATNPQGTPSEVKSDNPSIIEGALGSTSTVTFTLTRTGNLAATVVVNWVTANGTATAPSDYVAASGQVTFQPNETTKTVQVTVNGDDLQEPDENFILDLSTSTPGFVVTDGQATIVNDDITTITADNQTVTEGNAGSTALVTFTLSRTGVMSTVGVVNWTTTDGTATGGSDYVAASGQVTFQANETTKTVQITVNGDDLREFDETFNLVLSSTTPGWQMVNGQGRILNDDFTTISADNPSILEGGLGATSFVTFTLNRTGILTGNAVINWATADGTATAAQPDYVAASGQVTFQDGDTQKTVQVAVKGDIIVEPNETFNLVLSTSSPGCILNGGQATILNDDVTKFFVVNEATPDYAYPPYVIGAPSPIYGGPDRTYFYNPFGDFQGNVALDSANTAPRGAASTAAGDKLWVVDAYRTVYVYNSQGNLLGAWTPGTMLANALPEGITTDGVDIWIVDNLQNKVFRYADAASRLSGSQNAASSFVLNLGNINPKGIVTDGTSLWVVNDAAVDKVFKYNLAGTLLGSWTIDAANASPTGITLDPADVRHLWIVDNRSDRVYQYDDAVLRTSGSQAASLSYALAAGNANPQDIADPPVGAALASHRAVTHARRPAAPVRHFSAAQPLAVDWLAALDYLFSQENTAKRRR